MTQRSPDSPTITPSNISEPQKGVDRKSQHILRGFWEFLDQLGSCLFGDLWRMVYVTTQDALALSVLLTIPSWVGQRFGKDFSSFDLCPKENPWSVVRYACYIIVTSDFLLWILLAFRIFGRFSAECHEQWQRLKGRNDGSHKVKKNKPRK
jgi:hypothetical protein